MKEIINITNMYEIGAGNKNDLDKLTNKAHVRLYGTHSDTCALQRNYKFNKYFFDCHRRPLTWKMATRASFNDYHFNKYWFPRNEELA